MPVARVLIVDDDRAMCEALEVGIRRLGYTARWTTAGAEALAFLAGNDVDVLLTDVNMRGMSGLELCRRVVVARPDVPVVLMTAFGGPEGAAAAARAGAWDFLSKPIELDALARALERAVRHRKVQVEVAQLRQLVPVDGEAATTLAPLADVERRHVLQVMAAVGGNRALAARILGLGPKALARKLARYLVARARAG